MTSKKQTIIDEIQSFIKTYSTFPVLDYSFPLALWAIGTYVYPHFDAFPYLTITAATKRAGKTRLAELLSFVCSNPVSSGALTPAAMFKTMADEKPTLFFDEAEQLNSEAASTMRAVLNMGYRKGQVIRRSSKDSIKEYEVYCPKAFILIGDTNDTLRDRSILIRMRRADAPARFVYEIAKNAGAIIREKIAAAVDEKASFIIDGYLKFKGIEFLTDRDEEIWTPLFVLCSIFAPERMAELSTMAVDIATEKTFEAVKFTADEMRAEEEKARENEYRYQLLHDVAIVMGKQKFISTVELVNGLKALPTSPWRVYKGEGITVFSLATMLEPFQVGSANGQIGKGRKDRKIVKGYRLLDVQQGIELAGISPKAREK